MGLGATLANAATSGLAGAVTGGIGSNSQWWSRTTRRTIQEKQQRIQKPTETNATSMGV